MSDFAIVDLEVEDVASDGNDSDVHPGDTASNAPSSSFARSRLNADVYVYVKKTVKGVFECTPCRNKNECTEWRSRSTSNFRKHLIKHHGDLYSAKDPTQSTLRHHGFKTTSNKRKSVSSADFNTADKTLADSHLTNWIVNHSQPFVVVEHEDFIEFCSTLRDSYPLPTRNTIRNRIIKQWTEEKNRARVTIECDCGLRRYGTTSDMWTSAGKRGYMVVTMHYIDVNWRMRSVIIAFKRVLYPHSGERLASHLVAAVTEMSPRLLYGLWSITADNASTNTTMISELNDQFLPDAIKNYEDEEIAASADEDNGNVVTGSPRTVFQLRCIAHVLQLAVQNGLKSCPMLDNSIGRFRELMKKILDSPKLLEALASICSSLKVANKTPELDCETRWNSTWSMLSSVIMLKKPIQELLRRIRDRHDGFTTFSIKPNEDLAKHIDELTWHAMEDFCSFLKPFKDATALMSASEYPTLGMVIPVMHLLLEHVRRAIAENDGFRSTHGRNFAKAVQVKLLEYEELVNRREVKVAAALDPRVKGILATVGLVVHEVVSFIIEDYELEYQDAYESSRQSASESSVAETSSDSFLDLLDGHEQGRANVDEPFTGELNRWMAHAPMSMKQSSREVCEWFKVNQTMYPRIQMMAREYLALTATSVPSECAFSRAGTTINKRRARLGDDAVQAICELQSLLAFNASKARSA